MSIVYTQAFNYSEGGSMKNTEMDSKFGYSQTQQHCLQNNSGLMRYRSAPSSLLTSLVDTSIGFFNEETFRNESHHQQHYSTSTSSEMETMFTNSESLSVKQEEKDLFSNGIQYNDYSYGSQNQINYQTQHNQGFSNDSLGVEGNVFDGSSNNCSNLIRQKSSPAEFFSNYSVDSGMFFYLT